MTRPVATLRGRRVIVAAADPALVQLLTAVLRDAELRVYQAHDAQAAYELALELGVDVVVTNSCVGTVDGDILVNALRSRRPQLPVLHISAGRLQDRKVEEHIPPGVPSLKEPFTEQELLQAVATLLP